MHDYTIDLLYLNLVGKDIESLETRLEEEKLIIELKLKSKQQLCPICQSEDLRFLGYTYKKIIHSISTHQPCLIRFHQRRYRCKICHKTFSECNPFTKPYGNLSLYSRVKILNYLKSGDHTFTATAEHYNVSIQTVLNLFDESVESHRRRLPKVISIDEFYTAKMNKYKYACVLYDFIDHKIIDVLATRRKSYLIDYFSRISQGERAGVEVFIIDMWESYRDAIKLSFPNAKIAVDSFHVIRTLNSAIDRIRIDTINLYKQHKSGPAYDDMYYYMLKKFSYFFLKGYKDISDKYIKIHKINRYWHKSDILHYLLSIEETLSSAYRLKERYREFNLTATYDEAGDELYTLIEAFRNHKHPQMRNFGHTLIKWETEILNSFMIYDDRRISNVPIESTNNKIKTIIKTANGIKKFNRLRNRIMYSINKDIPFKN